MSNIANTIQYLNGDPTLRFIRITQQDNQNIIGKNDVYISDIPNGNLEEYIRFNLGPITKPTLVWVEMRSKKGTTSRKEHTCGIEISPINYQPQQQNAMNQLPVIQQESLSISNMLGNPGAGNVFGLGLADVIRMQGKADQLRDKQEQVTTLKEELKEANHRYQLLVIEHHNALTKLSVAEGQKEQLIEVRENYKEVKQKYRLLEVDHRDTLTKLSVAEAQKQMAVDLARLENKSFVDSPAFEKIMDNAPQLFSSFVAMKTGAVIPVQASLNAPAVSETHSELIEFINANINENQANFLGSVCRFINNEAFITQLKTLITQYAQV